ncbi:hypothetical protein MSG28_002575 [Choristoneura fumiferana]|uniref:Uncharacterized protein n=1 Tax=Choristoneura fumiferana TaxID=7141 RepID=A0ACC0JVY8_CHOFU|nr:hypothetical protein MSG28_002575 [Choristoneura fumiferana]
MGRFCRVVAAPGTVGPSAPSLQTITMVYNFKVFKKCAPNGKLTLYMAKRDFVDHITFVEPIGARVTRVETIAHMDQA